MKKLKNTQTRKSVDRFIEAVDNKKRKSDAKVLLALMKNLTQKEPKIWGTSIVGFGKYKYLRKNGEAYEWFNVGFSPGKAHLSIYVMYDLEQEQALLDQLGKHKKGRACLYIKKLEDINIDVLTKLINKSKKWSR